MQPFVSVIVPSYNEEKTIRHLLSAVYQQSYPRARMELIIADGMSTDHTRDLVLAFQEEHSDFNVKLVDNLARNIPAALNQAIRASAGEIIVRLDAHSMPIAEYVERCVAAHLAGKGDNVGGVWEIHPGADTGIARSISHAAAHPLGVGDAMYRLNASEGAVDTVPFGSFKRSLIEKIGFFDETLLANEDYEFNARVRESGGRVWLDPSIRCIYFSRSTLRALSAQYWRYGFWKLRMLKRYPHTIRWRQALPPVFVLSLIVLSVLSLLYAPFFYLLAAQVFVYFSVLGLAGMKLAMDENRLQLVWALPIAIATMHVSWGTGFLWSGVSSLFVNHG